MSREEQSKIIIGIDPGLASTGYGIIRDHTTHYTHIADGTIHTSTRHDRATRLEEIYSALSKVLARYAPDVAAIEGLFFAKNSSSAMPVAQVTGVIMLLLAQHRVPLYEYTPQHIKRLVTDYGLATKDQVRTMVRHLLADRLTHRISNHAVDGLAIALSCGHSRMHWYVS